MHYEELKRAVARSPEFRAHNLDMSAEEVELACREQPLRAPEQADFGAEAHGFTGFERAGKGSRISRKRNRRWHLGFLRKLVGRTEP
ncbi:MAG: hypothetical protein QNJ40_16950 [Xanthomonadales bacterium]|nr:hypothetical protein [Xanthomonadales bacterium]